MREIPSRNYIIYSFICVLTIALLICFVNIHNNNKEYQDSTNERMSFLREVLASEYEDFTSENNDYVMYISNSDDVTNAKLEDKLQKKLQKKDYINNMVYLNTKDVENDFLKLINDIYKKDFKSIPNIIIVNEDNIVDAYKITEATTVDDIVDFIEEYYD